MWNHCCIQIILYMKICLYFTTDTQTQTNAHTLTHTCSHILVHICVHRTRVYTSWQALNLNLYIFSGSVERDTKNHLANHLHFPHTHLNHVLFLRRPNPFSFHFNHQLWLRNYVHVPERSGMCMAIARGECLGSNTARGQFELKRFLVVPFWHIAFTHVWLRVHMKCIAFYRFLCAFIYTSMCVACVFLYVNTCEYMCVCMWV